MELKIEFTEKEITPWGSMVLMKKLIEKRKINEVLERIGLPKQQSNRGYNPIQLINNFWVSLWSGANRFEHLEVTRFDKVIQNIFGWRKMAGHKSFQRYFKKFSQADNQRVFTELFNLKDSGQIQSFSACLLLYQMIIPNDKSGLIVKGVGQFSAGNMGQFSAGIFSYHFFCVHDSE